MILVDSCLLRLSIIAVCQMLCLTQADLAHAQGCEDESCKEYLAGPYVLAGRLPDSETTYAGRVVLKGVDGKLKAIRTIDGRKTFGTAKVLRRDRGAPHPPVLAVGVHEVSMTFTQDGKRYWGYYLVVIDGDNYPQMSGKVWTEGEYKRYGIEALFREEQIVVDYLAEKLQNESND